MTEPTMGDAAAAPTPAEKAGLLDDLVDVLIAPASVFARRAHAKFGGALLIVSLAIGGLFLAARPVTQPLLQADMARANAKMTQPNVELTADQKAMAEKIGGIAGTIGGVVGPPIAILILGLFIWIVGRIFGAQVGAGQGVLIATYAYVPRIIASVLLVIQAYVLDASKMTSMIQLSLSPARFMSPETATIQMITILSRLDVFVLWSTALIAIGYHVVGKLSKGAAWGAAIVIWLLGIAPLAFAMMRAK